MRIHRSSSSIISFNKDVVSTHIEGLKPNGLWYSIDESWMEWVKTEMPDWMPKYKYAYEVLLDESKILILGYNDILPFTREYSHNSPTRGCIDWTRVARNYDGIEIPEYHWEFRLAPETFWYYGWDCASGCVWNSRAVLGINTI